MPSLKNKHVPEERKKAHASGSGILSRAGKLPDAIHELETRMILEALYRSGGNRHMAAQSLGITDRMLGYRLKQYGLSHD